MTINSFASTRGMFVLEETLIFNRTRQLSWKRQNLATAVRAAVTGYQSLAFRVIGICAARNHRYDAT